MSNTESAQLARTRRLAARQGFRLWKLSASSRRYGEYGPFALVDMATSFVGPRGLTLDEIETWLGR